MSYRVGTKEQEHVRVVFSAGWQRDLPRECQECQTSCQSACKTSCTVSNQPCPLAEKGVPGGGGLASEGLVHQGLAEQGAAASPCR